MQKKPNFPGIPSNVQPLKPSHLAGKPPTPVSGKGYVRFSSQLTQKVNEVNKVIQDNVKTLDAIQETALNLTGTAAMVASTAMTYIRMADSFMDTIVPILKAIPLIPPQLMKNITDLHKWANGIVDACVAVEKVSNNLRSSLQAGDIQKLQSGSGELMKVMGTLQKAIPAK